MTDAIHLLQELGFGDYEARAYQALLLHQPVTGYELARLTGIPRPNIYPVLQKLEARGAAVRVEDEDTTRYLAVPPEEFLAQVGQHFQTTLDAAGAALRTLNRPPEVSYLWQTQGYAHLLTHAHTLLSSVRSQLLIALWPTEARALAEPLAQAEARDVQITTLCMAACPQECGGCRGQIYRQRVLETPKARWLLLAADGEEVLAGEMITPDEAHEADAPSQVSVVRTRQKLLVELTSWFIRHSIAIATLLQDTGRDLEQRMQPETRAVLSAIGPRAMGGWLAYMRRLLSSTTGAP
jgi:sugar-specific transcriptional regulator TrmB